MTWTERDLVALRDNFPLQGANARGLDHLSKQKIYKKAYSLGLEREKVSRNDGNGEKWTTKEVEILQNRYPCEGSYIPELMVNHTRTAIQCKAERLGIKYIRRSDR